MENKKIRNTNPKEYNGIKFRSTLEVTVYKTLLQEGFNPEYEKHTWTLFEGFIPHVPFYTKNKFKRKDFRIKVLSRSTALDSRPLQGITYTPDFVFEYNGKKIIVEVKGYENDCFPMKFKMFRYELEHEEQETELWEIFTKKQLLECINRLRQSQTT